MADTERTFFEYLVYVSENHSPLDFMPVSYTHLTLPTILLV